MLQNVINPGSNLFPSVACVIVLDTYDGAVAGVMAWSPAGPCYRFELVGNIEDVHADTVRQYDLFPMRLKEFERLATDLTVVDTPRWPVWYPKNIDKVDSPEMQFVPGPMDKPAYRITVSDYWSFAGFEVEPSRKQELQAV